MGQHWVKDPVLSLLQLGLLLWCRFHPWPRNYVQRAWPKKKKKKREIDGTNCQWGRNGQKGEFRLDMPSPELAPSATDVQKVYPFWPADSSVDASPGWLSPGETSWGTAQPTHRNVGNNKLLFYAIKFHGCLLPEKMTSISKVLFFFYLAQTVAWARQVPCLFYIIAGIPTLCLL